METTKAQIAEAANYLVQARDYAAKVKQIAEVIAGWGERRVYFTGERECLNALVNLGLHFPDKLQRLYVIIETKRQQVPVLRRNEYQRAFMAQARDRLNKALEIEAIVEGRRLSADERAKRSARIRAEWAKRKQAFVSAKGDLDWKGRNAATQEFWGHVDTELTTMLDEARRVMELPHQRKRRVVRVDPKPPANRQMYEALQAVRTRRK